MESMGRYQQHGNVNKNIKKGCEVLPLTTVTDNRGMVKAWAVKNCIAHLANSIAAAKCKRQAAGCETCQGSL